jgi:hypothetical protein
MVLMGGCANPASSSLPAFAQAAVPGKPLPELFGVASFGGEVEHIERMTQASCSPRTARRHRLRRVLLYGGIALTLLIAGLYYARGEIGHMLARKLDERLVKAGVYLTWQSAAWVPGSGIQVNELALYRDAAKQERLALLGNVTLIKGDPDWDVWDKVSVRVRNARLTLQGGNDEMSLEHVNLRLDIQPGRVELLECLATLQGLRIDSKGTYVQAASESQADDGAAKAPAPSSTGDGDKVAAPQHKGLFDDLDLSWLHRLKEWTEVAGEGDDPVLKLEFRPLSDGSGLALAATLEAKKFLWRGKKWDVLQASLKTSLKKDRNSPVEISRLRVEHAGRHAEVAGGFDPASKVLRIEKFESGLDVLTFVQAFLPEAAAKLTDLAFEGEWDIRGKGEIPLDRPAESRWDGQAKFDGNLVYAKGGVRIELQDPVCALRGDELEVSAKSLKGGEGKGNRLTLLGEATLIKGHSTWDRWDQMTVRVKDAQLTLGSDDGETSLGHLSMQLETQPGGFELRECLASLLGWKVEAKGTYVKAAASPSKKGGERVPAPPSKKESAKVTASKIKKGSVKVTAPQEKGLFDDVDLGWLKTLKAWAKVVAEKDEPVMKIEFRSLPDDAGLDVAATMEGKNFKWRGEKWGLLQASVNTSLKTGKPPVDMCQLRLEHEGRSGAAEGVFDRAGHLLRIDKLDSGIDLPRLVRAIWPQTDKSLDSVTSKGRWDVNGTFSIPFDRPAITRWNGQVKLEGELAYAIGKGRVPLQDPVCTLRGQGLKVSISALKARLWEGKLDVPATQIYPPAGKAKTRFETRFTLKDARLESVMKSFGKTDKQPGVVQGMWQGGGGFGLAALTGSGTLHIQDAEFFQLPVLGTFSLLLDKLTPGFGRDQSSHVEAAYRMGDGKLQIEELTLTTHQIHLEAEGSIDLVRQYADVSTWARLKGLAGLVPIVRRVEAKGRGPLGSVEWKRD